MTPPLRIAIVESDDLIRELLSRWLQQAGYEVDHTSADALPTRGHALVIVAVPGADAAGPLVTEIRTRSNAPLLLISARFGRRTAGSAALAERLGVQAVLPIPFSEDNLIPLVRKLAKRS